MQQRGICHQPPVKKIYSHLLEYRAVPHRVMVNSGYFIIGRTQRRWAFKTFFTRKQGHNSRLLQNYALQNLESEIPQSTLQRGPGRSRGSAPFRLWPETTSSQGFSLKHRGKEGEFRCTFKPRTSNHTVASASCLPLARRLFPGNQHCPLLASSKPIVKASNKLVLNQEQSEGAQPPALIRSAFKNEADSRASGLKK